MLHFPVQRPMGGHEAQLQYIQQQTQTWTRDKRPALGTHERGLVAARRQWLIVGKKDSPDPDDDEVFPRTRLDVGTEERGAPESKSKAPCHAFWRQRSTKCHSGSSVHLRHDADQEQEEGGERRTSIHPSQIRVRRGRGWRGWESNTHPSRS